MLSLDRRQAEASWRLGRRAHVLRDIARPHVTLVSWHTRPLVLAQGHLEHWASHHATVLDAPTRCDDLSGVRDALTAMPEPTRSLLLHDVTDLARRFGAITQQARIQLRFGVVATDMCRKFHEDYLRFRLLTTYFGPGTEWVPEQAVDRRALARRIECAHESNRSVVPDASQIRRSAPRDVILMKGVLHPERRGAIHRSPPIQESGLRRIVLSLSTLEGS